MQYTTSLFADSWDGRLVLVLNVFGENRRRMAIYASSRGDSLSWRRIGVYSGHAAAAAVRDGGLWVFFEGGFARVYRLAPGGGTPDGAGRPGGGPPPPAGRAGGAPAAVRLPFDWTPASACRGEDGSLWVVGACEGRIAASRLPPGLESGAPVTRPAPGVKSGPRSSRLPPGEAAERWSPAPDGPRLARAGGDEDAGVPAGRGGGPQPKHEGARAVTIRACVCGDLYVFWSVAGPRGGAAAAEAGEDGPRAQRIRAARLVLAPTPAAHGGESSPSTEGARWDELPALEAANDDFLPAPARAGPGGERRRPALLVRRSLFRDVGQPPEGLLRAVFNPEEGGWSRPEPVGLTRERFLFGYIPSAAWVDWEDGALLLRSNTQRVDVIRRGPRGWERLRRSGWARLHLTEIELVLVAAGAALLVVTGGAAFALRVRRLRRGEARAPLRRPLAAGAGSYYPGAEGPGQGARSGAPEARALAAALDAGLPPAPIAHRLIAAALDLTLVAALVVSLVGFPDAPSDPLAPDAAHLATHGAVLAALAAYSAALEALWGATLGKIAMGLRVVGLARVTGPPAAGSPRAFAGPKRLRPRRQERGLESPEAGGPQGPRDPGGDTDIPAEERIVPPRPWQALVRNLLRPLDLFPPYTGSFGLGAMVVTRRRQRLGDLAAKTLVVSDSKAGAPSSASVRGS